MTPSDSLSGAARQGPASLKSPDERGVPHLALTMTRDGKLDVMPEGDWKSIGGASKAPEVAFGIARQLAALGEHGQRISETASNEALVFVSEMKPRDPAELLLLTQMAAVHQATMTMARRLNHVETIPQQDAAERAPDKLARTFSGQVETLKRYRSKGTQTVRVERVTVESGGQAVVGSVQAGGRASGER